MTPRIVYSPIGDRWFVTQVARREDGRERRVEIRKHDVTDQMRAILKKHGRAAVKDFLAGRLTRLW